MAYRYTGSSTDSATSTGLSTQILVKVDGVAIGGIQSLSISQNRPIKAITEVGTDGNIEIVPSGATTFELDIDRIYFDRKTITEAFNRQFINIQAQRYPFDIFVYDMHNVSYENAQLADGFDVTTNGTEVTTGVMVTVYENCWFASKTDTYSSNDYVIVQRARVTAEFCHTFQDNVNTSAVPANAGGNDAQNALWDVERFVDRTRPGSLDTRGRGNIVS